MRKILKTIKDNLKVILIGIIILIILIFGYFLVRNLILDIREKNINDYSWLNDNVNIVIDKNMGNNINVIDTKDYIDIFKTNYQLVVDEKINKLISNNEYSYDDMLIIYNPYGTNKLSFNVYFKSDDLNSLFYTISVDDENVLDYSNTLLNNKIDDTYAYQVIGLVPGYINNIEFVLTDSNNNTFNKKITIDASGINCNTDTYLDIKDGDSDKRLENGLYTLFGLDKAFNADNYLYDNNGILRADLVLEDYRSDRIIFNDNKMIYSYNNNKFSVINNLGMIEKEYTIKGYTMHHDYILDSNNNKLLILVNKNEEEDKTIEDLIISLDLENGDIEEIIDMKDLLPDMYNTASMPEGGKNTYGGTGLDWIHLNSLSLVNSKEDIVISSRELSTIIYLSDIYTNPTIKYLIADSNVYKGTAYEDLVLDKIGSFVSNAGQHTITYVESDELNDGEYYLEMYNNNYGSSNTRSDFPWEYYENVGTFNEGDNSYYYKYLVNENNNTYELVKSFSVDYSSIVSSVQDLGANHITSSGKSNSYAEYDNNGVLIRQFNYTSKKYAYRVFKYSFNDFWFNN